MFSPSSPVHFAWQWATQNHLRAEIGEPASTTPGVLRFPHITYTVVRNISTILLQKHFVAYNVYCGSFSYVIDVTISRWWCRWRTCLVFLGSTSHLATTNYMYTHFRMLANRFNRGNIGVGDRRANIGISKIYICMYWRKWTLCAWCV